MRVPHARTGFPITNTPLAMAFIRADAAKVMPTKQEMFEALFK